MKKDGATTIVKPSASVVHKITPIAHKASLLADLLDGCSVVSHVDVSLLSWLYCQR